MSPEHWGAFHDKVTKHIDTHGVPDGEHVFYSRLKRQGVVAEVNHAKRRIKYITTLPVGVSRVSKDNTGKHLIESALGENIPVFVID